MGNNGINGTLKDGQHAAPASAPGVAEIAREMLAQLRAEAKPAPLLLDGKSTPTAWEFIGISRSEFFRLKAAGKVPDAVALPGRSTGAWRREDLEAFVKRLKPAR